MDISIFELIDLEKKIAFKVSTLKSGEVTSEMTPRDDIDETSLETSTKSILTDFDEKMNQQTTTMISEDITIGKENY